MSLNDTDGDGWRAQCSEQMKEIGASLYSLKNVVFT